MGIFNEEENVVFFSSSPLLQQPEDPVAATVAAAVLKNVNIRDALMDYCFNGMAIKAKQVYNYGLNHYTLGLPQGTSEAITGGAADIIQPIVESIAGTTVTINYAVIAPLSPKYAIINWLIDSRGYNPATNIITSPPFTLPGGVYVSPVYLYATEQNGNLVHITYYYAYRAGGDGGELVHVYEQEYKLIPAGIVIGDDYCIVGYTPDGSTTREYWLYRLADGTYPAINADLELYGSYSYMPIVPMRRHGYDLCAEAMQDTELYETSRKLLKKMKVDIDEIADRLNENENIDDPVEGIDDAFIIFAVDVMTENKESITYLANYFEYLKNNAEYQLEDHETTPFVEANFNTFPTERVSNSMTEPAVELLEYGLDIGIGFDYVTVEMEAGSIGPVNSAVSTYEIDFGLQMVTVEGEESPVEMPYDSSWITFSVQVETNLIKRVTVVGLQMLNLNIYLEESAIVPLARAIGEADDYTLLVPVHYGIAARMNIMQRNILFGESAQLVCNGHYSYTVHWYESYFFRTVLIIVGMVIAMYSGGNWIAGLMTELTTGLAAAMVYVMEGVLTMMAVNYGLKFVVDLIGPELAMILSVALAVVGATLGLGSGMNRMFTTFKITAKSLLTFSTAVINAADKSVKEEIAAIYGEMKTFQEFAEAEMDKLQREMEGLKFEPLLDPLLFTSVNQPIMIIGEEPDDFYERTIHKGNPGVSTLNMIENFVGSVLELPEPDPYSNLS